MGLLIDEIISGPGEGGRLRPLSRERVTAALDAEQWSYSIDEDGDIGGGWEYASFFFFVNGDHSELLCIRGTWRGILDAADYGRAIELCNEWNSEKFWPKTYARPDESGTIRIHIEHNVDFEQGVSDGQLTQQLICAVDTGMVFFEQVNEVFPEVWERYRPTE